MAVVDVEVLIVDVAVMVLAVWINDVVTAVVYLKRDDSHEKTSPFHCWLMDMSHSPSSPILLEESIKAHFGRRNHLLLYERPEDQNSICMGLSRR